MVVTVFFRVDWFCLSISCFPSIFVFHWFLFFFVMVATQGELEIHKAFTSTEFIKKLINFLSLEENKGSDHYNTKRVNLFKVRVNMCKACASKKMSSVDDIHISISTSLATIECSFLMCSIPSNYMEGVG